MDKNKQKSYSDKEIKSIKVALFFIAAVLSQYEKSVVNVCEAMLPTRLPSFALKALAELG